MSAFDEWLEQDITIIPQDIEPFDLKTVWDAAIDEAVKVIKDNQCNADGYHACSHQDVFAALIKELKK